MTSELDEVTETRLTRVLQDFEVEPSTNAGLFNIVDLQDRHKKRTAHRQRVFAVCAAACAGGIVGILAALGQFASPRTITGTTVPHHANHHGTIPIIVGQHIVLTSQDESEMQALLAKYRAGAGVTRAAAKLVPYTDVEMIPGVRGGSPVASPPLLVVAIALSGHMPEEAPGMTLPNGKTPEMTYEFLVLNPSTGAVLSDTGGAPQTWPPGFDALPNLPVGTIVPLPTTLDLGLTDNGKTFVIAPSSKISIDLPGSSLSPWTLPPTPYVDSPVLVETSASNESGSLTSQWIASIDGTQTISSEATCESAASCTPQTWSITITVRG